MQSGDLCIIYGFTLHRLIMASGSYDEWESPSESSEPSSSSDNDLVTLHFQESMD